MHLFSLAFGFTGCQYTNVTGSLQENPVMLHSPFRLYLPVWLERDESHSTSFRRQDVQRFRCVLDVGLADETIRRVLLKEVDHHIGQIQVS